MYTTDFTPCEIAREFLFVASQSRAKAKRYPSLATSYLQVDLEMKRAVYRHTARCETCLEVEWRNDGGVLNA